MPKANHDDALLFRQNSLIDLPACIARPVSGRSRPEARRDAPSAHRSSDAGENTTSIQQGGHSQLPGRKPGPAEPSRQLTMMGWNAVQRRGQQGGYKYSGKRTSECWLPLSQQNIH